MTETQLIEFNIRMVELQQAMQDLKYQLAQKHDEIQVLKKELMQLKKESKK